MNFLTKLHQTAIAAIDVIFGNEVYKQQIANLQAQADLLDLTIANEQLAQEYLDIEIAKTAKKIDSLSH